MEPVRAVQGLRDGRWLFCRADGLFLGDPETERLALLAPTSPEGCQAVTETKDGRIWAWDANGQLAFTKDRRTWTTLVPALEERLRWAFIGEDDAWGSLEEKIVHVQMATGVVKHIDPERHWRIRKPRAVGLSGGSSLFVSTDDGLIRLGLGMGREPITTLSSITAANADGVLGVIEHQGLTWVATDAGLTQVSPAGRRPEMSTAEFARVGQFDAPSVPRVDFRGDEVWAISRRGQVGRVEGGALVEEAIFDRLHALRVSPDEQIWVGGEGRVLKQELNGTWRSWDVSFSEAHLQGHITRPLVQALVFDDDGTVLLGTSRGLFRLDPADGALSALPLFSAPAPDIYAAERKGDVLYLGTTRGLYVVMLRSAPPLPSRHRLAPFYTGGLDWDGPDLLVSSDAGSYRIDVLGLSHTIVRRPFLCTGSACRGGKAIARGDGVAWIGLGSRVTARPTGWRAPGPCGRWDIPYHDNTHRGITDLSMASDGTLWAATSDSLNALDTASCVGRTLLWPLPGRGEEVVVNSN